MLFFLDFHWKLYIWLIFALPCVWEKKGGFTISTWISLRCLARQKEKGEAGRVRSVYCHMGNVYL